MRSEDHFPSLFVRLKCLIAYAVLFTVSIFKELFYGPGPTILQSSQRHNWWNEGGHRSGYPALYDRFYSFFIKNVFRRGKDAFWRPIGSAPAGSTTFISRVSDDYFWTCRMDPTSTRQCINLASYNYLGFAETSGPIIDSVLNTLVTKGNAHCSPRSELGRMAIHGELEAAVASFLGTEDAMAVGMGFATNALTLPSLVSTGCLVLSDEKNHASIILGLKISGATVKVFRHNDLQMLENLIRSSILEGHPGTKEKTPWKKVFIVVEGIYSMEGTILDLPAVVSIKKRYGAYLYVDEAHSIGSIGPNGSGIVGYHKMDPSDVDILMGTFTKSFGSVGGYIAGKKKLINHLKVASHSNVYGSPISPPMACQVIECIKVVKANERGLDGLSRTERLARNVRRFRNGLEAIGCIVLGDDHSPVVPVKVCSPGKLVAVVRRLFDLGTATVAVGFPVVPMGEEKIRFCVSADHTERQIEESLATIRRVAQEIGIIYATGKS